MLRNSLGAFFLGLGCVAFASSHGCGDATNQLEPELAVMDNCALGIRAGASYSFDSARPARVPRSLEVFEPSALTENDSATLVLDLGVAAEPVTCQYEATGLGMSLASCQALDSPEAEIWGAELLTAFAEADLRATACLLPIGAEMTNGDWRVEKPESADSLNRGAVHAEIAGSPSDPSTEGYVPPGMRSQETEGVSEAAADAYYAALALAPKSAATMIQSIATDTPPEVDALARALEYDIDAIFTHVHDSIEVITSWGLKKHPVAVMLDRSGTAADLANLMVELLRVSGYDAQFVKGNVVLSGDEIRDWFGTRDKQMLGRIAATSGIPSPRIGVANSVVQELDFQHVWVRARGKELGETWYHFDPSFKKREFYPRTVDVAAASGYSRGELFSRFNAAFGPDFESISGFDYPGTLELLHTWASRLANTLRSSRATPVVELLGGRPIVSIAGEPVRRDRFHTHRSLVAAPAVVWQRVPDSHRTALRFRIGGIDARYFADDLVRGERLTFRFGSDLRVRLYREGVVVATATQAGTTGQAQNLRVDIDEPYAASNGEYQDQSGQLSLDVGRDYTFSVVLGFGNTGRDMVERYRKATARAIVAGQSETSEEVLGSTLTQIGALWLSQLSQETRLYSAINDMIYVPHHMVGIAGQTTAPFVDIPFASGVSLGEGGIENTIAVGVFASALESAVVAQTQGVRGVSTTSLFEHVASKPGIFYAATKKTWPSVRQQLAGYPTGLLNTIGSEVNGGAVRYVLPKSGSQVVDQWQGYAFLRIDGNSVTAGINGRKGGFSSRPVPRPVGTTARAAPVPSMRRVAVISGDPVDVTSGDFVMDHTDMSTGPLALGFQFERKYSSGSELHTGVLGRGWDHNFNLTLTRSGDGFQGMGEDSLVDAAQMLIANFVTRDVLSAAQGVRNTTIAALVAQWAVDQLSDNSVTVSSWGSSYQFVRVPNGVDATGPRYRYEPPPGIGDSLGVAGHGRFVHTSRLGIKTFYDAEGRVTSIESPRGHTQVFSYEHGKLTRVTHPFGWYFELTYVGDLLHEVVDSSARVVAYRYSDDDRLLGVTNTVGQETQFTYVGATGRLAKIFYPQRPATAFVENRYDAMGHVWQQLDALGHTTEYRIAGSRSVEVRPGGLRTEWFFNSAGRPYRHVDELGRTTTTVYNGMRLPSRVNSPGGYSVDMFYDGRGNSTLTKLFSEGREQSLTTRTTYHPKWNRPTSVTDARGNVTTFTYNSYGEATSSVLPSVSGQGSARSTATYNDLGLIETTTDPSGRASAALYDTRGLLIRSTPDNSRPFEYVEFGYNDWGDADRVTNEAGVTTTASFRRDRKIQTINGASPDGSTAGPVEEFFYNKNGDLTITQRVQQDGSRLKIQRGYTARDEVAWVTEPFVGTFSASTTPRTINTYDNAGRLVETKDPTGERSRTSYYRNGLVWTVTRAWGTAEQSTYFKIVYNDDNQIRWIEDGNGGRTTYQYDGFGRLEKTRYPDPAQASVSSTTDFEQYTYDATNNRLTQRTRSGEVFSFEYDALNRVTSRSGAGLPKLINRYDAAGRIVEVSYGDLRSEMIYDGRGRLVQSRETELSSGRVRSLLRRYDSVSNLVSLNLYGYSVNYAYDHLNRVTRISDAATETEFARFQYDRLSRRRKMVRPGVTTHYDYSTVGRLTAIRHEGNGPHDVGFYYDHDKSGRVIREGTDNDAFRYSPGSPSAMHAPADGLNRLTAWGGQPVAYESNGNLQVLNGLPTLSHTPLNQLQSIGGSVRFTYDGLGRRVLTDDGATLRSTYMDSTKVVEDSGLFIRRYIPGPEQGEVIMIRERNPDGSFTNRYPLVDGRGSRVAFVKNGFSSHEGVVRYSPFGEISGPVCQASDRGCVTLSYTGHHLEGHSRLLETPTRFYAPQVARFLETDPLRLSDGPNLYAYVGGDPINYTDPMGTERGSNRGTQVASTGLTGFAVGVFANERPSLAPKTSPLPRTARRLMRGALEKARKIMEEWKTQYPNPDATGVTQPQPMFRGTRG